LLESFNLQKHSETKKEISFLFLCFTHHNAVSFLAYVTS